MASSETGRKESAGHRQRLRARLERATDAALEDHELLELLLTFSIPRVDTKPLARGLLTRFGNLAGVFSAADPKQHDKPHPDPQN